MHRTESRIPAAIDAKPYKMPRPQAKKVIRTSSESSHNPYTRINPRKRPQHPTVPREGTAGESGLQPPPLCHRGEESKKGTINAATAPAAPAAAGAGVTVTVTVAVATTSACFYD